MTSKNLSLILSLSLCLTACIQADNSSSLDEDLYGAGSAVGTPAFLAARTVFRSNCIPCHDYGSKSEAALLQANLFIAGDAENSPLYYRLAGSSGAQGEKNMPGNGVLSASDVSLVKTWIDSATP